MIFSNGDWIASVVGGFAFFKWLMGRFNQTKEKEQTHDQLQDDKLIQLRSDFAAHEREDSVQLKWIRDSLERIERRVENLQSQMRNVAIEHFKERD